MRQVAHDLALRFPLRLGLPHHEAFGKPVLERLGPQWASFKVGHLGEYNPLAKEAKEGKVEKM